VRTGVWRPIATGMALSVTAGHAQDVRFIPETAALGYAVRAYEAIWQEHGGTIVAALEARTCLRFSEPSVLAIVADRTSHSGGPDHPMQLRASYSAEVKQSTLVHELGHRHLWRLEERLDDVDGHMTLYLILDLVWADVWGEPFAEAQVMHESGWRSEYDYAEAWSWARSLGVEERARLWHELLALNGLESDCDPTTQ
jgi:hypothetical protein